MLKSKQQQQQQQQQNVKITINQERKRAPRKTGKRKPKRPDYQPPGPPPPNVPNYVPMYIQNYPANPSPYINQPFGFQNSATQAPINPLVPNPAPVQAPAQPSSVFQAPAQAIQASTPAPYVRPISPPTEYIMSTRGMPLPQHINFNPVQQTSFGNGLYENLMNFSTNLSTGINDWAIRMTEIPNVPRTDLPFRPIEQPNPPMNISTQPDEIVDEFATPRSSPNIIKNVSPINPFPSINYGEDETKEDLYPPIFRPTAESQPMQLRVTAEPMPERPPKKNYRDIEMLRPTTEQPEFKLGEISEIIDKVPLPATIPQKLTTFVDESFEELHPTSNVNLAEQVAAEAKKRITSEKLNKLFERDYSETMNEDEKLDLLEYRLGEVDRELIIQQDILNEKIDDVDNLKNIMSNLVKNSSEWKSVKKELDKAKQELKKTQQILNANKNIFDDLTARERNIISGKRQVADRREQATNISKSILDDIISETADEYENNKQQELVKKFLREAINKSAVVRKRIRHNAIIEEDMQNRQRRATAENFLNESIKQTINETNLRNDADKLMNEILRDVSNKIKSTQEKSDTQKYMNQLANQIIDESLTKIKYVSPEVVAPPKRERDISSQSINTNWSDLVEHKPFGNMSDIYPGFEVKPSMSRNPSNVSDITQPDLTEFGNFASNEELQQKSESKKSKSKMSPYVIPEDEEEPEPETQPEEEKKSRGRPKGSVNVPKEVINIDKQFREKVGRVKGRPQNSYSKSDAEIELEADAKKIRKNIIDSQRQILEMETGIKSYDENKIGNLKSRIRLIIDDYENVKDDLANAYLSRITRPTLENIPEEVEPEPESPPTPPIKVTKSNTGNSIKTKKKSDEKYESIRKNMVDTLEELGYNFNDIKSKYKTDYTEIRNIKNEIMEISKLFKQVTKSDKNRSEKFKDLQELNKTFDDLLDEYESLTGIFISKVKRNESGSSSRGSSFSSRKSLNQK